MHSFGFAPSLNCTDAAMFKATGCESNVIFWNTRSNVSNKLLPVSSSDVLEPSTHPLDSPSMHTMAGLPLTHAVTARLTRGPGRSQNKEAKLMKERAERALRRKKKPRGSGFMSRNSRG